MVIDWRAPVSRPFYRASPAEPMGLARRRRFGFSGGELTAYEDEDFTGAARAGAVPVPPAPGAVPAVPPASRILIQEIERPRSGPMRDIVATIQPDQDDIVRAGADQTVCVQGAPGTGKTAVGLHRVAYLLYAHSERMRRGGVLVVGPNRAFLAYIRNVLPALGELDVTQLSVTDLLATVPVRAAEPEHAAKIKGDARMAEVLRRALWRQIAEPAEPIMLARGSRRWRVAAHELAVLVEELRLRGVRYGTGREMLSHRIAHVILTRMEAAGETCDDRTHEAVRRSAAVRAAVNAIWPKTDPVRLVFGVLSDPGLLLRASRDLLNPGDAFVDLRTPGATYPEVLVSMRGPHQGDNAACAVAAAEAFFAAALDPEVVEVALGNVVVPGRMEVVGRRPLTLLDGAHNVAGMRTLAGALTEEFAHRGRGGRRGRHAPRPRSLGHARPVGAAPGCGPLVACAPDSPRALPVEVVAEAARSLGMSVSVAASVAEAVAVGRSLVADDGLLVVAGSLYVVTDARRVLLEGASRPVRPEAPAGCVGNGCYCAPLVERTLVIVKPDGVERGLVGEIVGRLERKGLAAGGGRAAPHHARAGRPALRRARGQALLRRPGGVHHPLPGVRHGGRGSRGRAPGGPDDDGRHGPQGGGTGHHPRRPGRGHAPRTWSTVRTRSSRRPVRSTCSSPASAELSATFPRPAGSTPQFRGQSRP